MSKKMMSFYIDEYLHDALRDYSEQTGIPMANVVRKSIAKELQRLTGLRNEEDTKQHGSKYDNC